MVVVEEVFADTPVTVTKPEPLIETEPAVAVPLYVKLASKLLI